jgi:hypothetical protein
MMALSMDANPFQPPTETGTHSVVVSESHRELKRVAVYQKCFLLCTLLFFLLAVGTGMVPSEFEHVFDFLMLSVVLVGAAFVFLLSIKLFGFPLGILFGLASLVPLVGLFVLVGINVKASHVLRENGVKVRLFGGKPSEL